MNRFLGIAAMVAITVVPTAEAQKKAPDTRAEVQRFVKEFFGAMNGADIAALVEMYARVPEVASISDGEVSRGWEAIRSDADSLLGKQGSYRVDVGSTDVVALGTAYAIAFAGATITTQGSQGPQQVRGAITLVLKKTPSGWKILHEHMSTQGVEEQGD